jgi:hypothetical protein
VQAFGLDDPSSKEHYRPRDYGSGQGPQKGRTAINNNNNNNNNNVMHTRNIGLGAQWEAQQRCGLRIKQRRNNIKSVVFSSQANYTD